MKKILIKILIIISVLVALDRISDYLFTKYIFEKTISGQAGGTVNYLSQRKSNVDLLILGTSRAVHQIDPGVLDTSSKLGYNAGVDGVGRSVYNEILLDITANKIHPKVLIFQTDVGDYFDQSQSAYDNQLRAQYPFYNQSLALRDYIGKAGLAEKIKLFFEMYRFNGKVFNILANYAKRKGIPDNTGFIPLFGTIKENQIPPKRETKNVKSKIDERGIEALKQIISYCSANHIKLFIVLPPSFDNISYDKKNLDIFKTNIPVAYLIDMSDVSLFVNLKDKENWKDVAHFNNVGAGKFSNYLRDSLITRNAFN
jgi:hypothetical protein